MDNIVDPNECKSLKMSALKTTLYTGCYIGLCGSSMSGLSRTSVLADLAALELGATGGYARQAVAAWSSISIDGSTHYAKMSPTSVPSWGPSSGSWTVYGYFLTDSTQATCMGYCAFASPITVTNPDLLQLSIEADQASIFSN